MGFVTYAIRPLGPLDVSDRQPESVFCQLRGTREQTPPSRRGAPDG